MRTPIILLFLVSLIFAGPLHTHGQKLGNVKGKTVKMRPKGYSAPTGLVLPMGSDALPRQTGNEWIVFSDRDNNPTYPSGTGSGSTYKKMNFMDAFYVIDETPTHVRVVKYDPQVFANPKTFKLDATAQDYGWAPKKKVLLWKFGLVAPSTQFTIKALTTNTPESLQNPTAYLQNGKLVRLFNDPDLGSSSENQRSIQLFEFLFIYKKTENAVLIGRSEYARAGSAQNTVLGWVSKNMIQIWDQRLVLEPNWEAAAVAERDRTNVAVAMFSTEGSADAYRQSRPPATDPLWQDMYPTRRQPQWRRFPVLRKLGNDLFQTGYVTDLVDSYGKVLLKTPEYISLEKEKEEFRAELRNINIVFVVDGTTSMGPYFSSIVNAIRASANLFEGETKNTYRLGAVIYRDYAEANCPGHPDRLLDIQPLGKPSRVSRFFESKIPECVDYCDRDKPEAVYHGIDAALRMLRERGKRETKYLILVGDAGNRLDDERHNEADIRKKLAQMNCGMAVFQVNNGNDETFNDFVIQSQRMVKSTQNENVGQVRLTRMQGVENGFQLDYPNVAKVPGSIVFPATGGTINPDVLQRNLMSMLKQREEEGERRLEEMESAIESSGVRMNAALAGLLEGFISDQRLLDIILQEKKYRLFILGYTPLKRAGFQHSLYKYVLLINDDERANLIRMIKEVEAPQSSQLDKRERIVNVFTEMIITRYGRREGKRLLKEKPASEIWGLLSGLPTNEASCPWPNRIDDIREPSYDLTELTDCLDRKLNALRGIRPDESFTSNDVTYYWIPQDYMP